MHPHHWHLAPQKRHTLTKLAKSRLTDNRVAVSVKFFSASNILMLYVLFS